MSTPRPFGDGLCDAIRHYLKTNGKTNLGQINAEILSDLAERFYAHFTAQQKAKKKRADATPREIAVYLAYPRQVGRADALAAIKGALEKGVGVDRLLGAATQYSACVAKWPKSYRYQEGRDMVPYPATWFRAERYLDNPREWMPAGSFVRLDDPQGPHGSSPALHPLQEPEGWKTEFPESVFKTWEEVPTDSKRAICDHMNKLSP